MLVLSSTQQCVTIVNSNLYTNVKWYACTVLKVFILSKLNIAGFVDSTLQNEDSSSTSALCGWE